MGWKIRSSNPGGQEICHSRSRNYCPGNNIQDAPGHSAHVDEFHSRVKVVLIDHTSIIQLIEQRDITKFKAYFSVNKPTNTLHWGVTPVYSLPPTRFAPPAPCPGCFQGV